MLWFQGAIPAAIASAKRSGAVFVVFVAGEGGGGPSCDPTPLRPTSNLGFPPAFPPCSDRPRLPSLTSQDSPFRLGHPWPAEAPSSRFSHHPGRRHRPRLAPRAR